ncbi:MAG: cytochrome c [Bacteroidota bacterium]
MIDLEIVTAKAKDRMLKNRLITLATDGQLLQSDGMIFFKAPPGVAIDPQAPIRVKVPTQNYASEMQLFKAIQKDGQMRWRLQSALQETETLRAIQNGKTLFNQYCANCHHRNLREDMTGPALGNITQFRDSSFLVDFTRNSVGLITSGNPLANCLYNQWNKTVMPSYDSLSTQQMVNIYQWIESKSKNDAIGLSEVVFIDSCQLAKTYLFSYDQWGNVVDSILLGPYASLDTLGPVFPRSSSRNSITKELKYYEFEVSDFGWYNVDDFLGQNFPLIENFKIQIEKNDAKEIHAFVVFQDRNIIIPLEYYQGYYYLRLGAWKEEIAFPLKQKMWLVAIEASEERQVHFASKSIISKVNNNEHELRMSKLSKEELTAQLRRFN